MTDERLKRVQTENRQDRAVEDRSVTQNRQLEPGSLDLEALVDSFSQAHLPDLPEIPGFHVCWLSTINPRDTIQMRQRLGYVLIKAEDVQGWDYSTLKSAEYPGVISVNEMVAAKVPVEIFQKLMHLFHVKRPNEEEGKLSAMLDVIRDQAARSNVKVQEGDGFRDL